MNGMHIGNTLPGMKGDAGIPETKYPFLKKCHPISPPFFTQEKDMYSPVMPGSA